MLCGLPEGTKPTPAQQALIQGQDPLSLMDELSELEILIDDSEDAAAYQLEIDQAPQQRAASAETPLTPVSDNSGCR